MNSLSFSLLTILVNCILLSVIDFFHGISTRVPQFVGVYALINKTLSPRIIDVQSCKIMKSRYVTNKNFQNCGSLIVSDILAELMSKKQFYRQLELCSPLERSTIPTANR